MPKPPPVKVTYADGRTEIVPAREFEKRKFSYHRYRRSRKWRVLRLKVLERDGRRCRGCKRSNVKLEVHHLTYDRIGDERLSDLLTLCQRCHAADHQWRRRGRPLFTEA